MREAITFLMEMLFISITFFLGYKLIFHHSTPTFRRWYLLAWLTFSAAFPLITVDILVSSPISSASVGDFVLDSDTPLFLEPLSATTPMQDFGATESSMPVEEDRPKAAFNWKLLLATAYALVVIALLSRIVLGYLQMTQQNIEAVVQSTVYQFVLQDQCPFLFHTLSDKDPIEKGGSSK